MGVLLIWDFSIIVLGFSIVLLMINLIFRLQDYIWITIIFPDLKQNVPVTDGATPEQAVQLQPQKVKVTIRPSKLRFFTL